MMLVATHTHRGGSRVPLASHPTQAGLRHHAHSNASRCTATSLDLGVFLCMCVMRVHWIDGAGDVRKSLSPFHEGTSLLTDQTRRTVDVN